MLRIRKEWKAATCVADLSYLDGKISSSIYTEKYPKIGQTYEIESVYLINEQRNADGRCVPRRHECGMDVVKVHLKNWTSEEDEMGFESGFPCEAFIFDKTSDQIYTYLLGRGINIRIPGFEDTLSRFISKGYLRLDYWWLKKTDKQKKQYNDIWRTIEKTAPKARLTPEYKELTNVWRLDCLPGGCYYNKPYHGLTVIDELVVENDSHIPKKKTPSIDTKRPIKEPSVDIDIDFEF